MENGFLEDSQGVCVQGELSLHEGSLGAFPVIKSYVAVKLAEDFAVPSRSRKNKNSSFFRPSQLTRRATPIPIGNRLARASTTPK